jgi:HK97 gp10 family phage protein
MRLDIQVYGIEQLKELAGAFSSEMVARTAQNMQDSVDANVIGNAKSMSPVKTGALRDSIHSEISGQFGVWVIAGMEYATFVEFGHRTRSGSLVPPHPFLEPAVMEGMDFVTQQLAQLIESIFGEHGL